MGHHAWLIFVFLVEWSIGKMGTSITIDQLIQDEVFAMAKEVYQSVPLYEPICKMGTSMTEVA